MQRASSSARRRRQVESSRHELIHLFCASDSDEGDGSCGSDLGPESSHDNDWIRSRLALELVESEKKYVESLEMLVRTFGQRVEDRLKEVAPALADLIRIIHVITGLNRRFLDELEARMQSWTTTVTIGDVFLAFAPFLRMYSSYAIQHQDGTRVLHDLRQKGYTLSKLINDAASSEWRANSLESFLILPVQRLPRYQLLFQQLSERTPPDHPDYQNLQDAFRQAASVAGQINEAVRNRENCFKILEIQNRFIGEVTLLAPHRRLIRSGTLVKICRSTKQSREFFLFNDMLIYARGAPGTLHGLKLNRQILIDSSFEESSLATGMRQAGCVIDERNHSVKSFTVMARTQEDKVDWLLRIMNVLDEYKRSRNAILSSAKSAPIWQPNNQSSVCSVCSNQFHVLFRRKHHCRKCGALVCAKCSKNRAMNSHAGSLDRVCRACVSHFRGMSAAASSPPCMPSSSGPSRMRSNTGGDDDFSCSSSLMDGGNSYAGDPALQALADEAIATVKRMSSAPSYQPGLHRFRLRSHSVSGTTPHIRTPIVSQSVNRTFLMEASRSIRRLSLSHLTSRRVHASNVFNADSVLYLRAIMPRSISNGAGLDFEIGDLVAVDEIQSGELCAGVNIRTQKRGRFSFIDMIELGHVAPGQYGCPGVANTAFDVSAYHKDSAADRGEPAAADSARTAGDDDPAWSGSQATIPRNLLSLCAGDCVEVVDARSIEWWSGHRSSGEFGWFPAEYVSLACSRPAPSQTTMPSCQLCSCALFLTNVFDSRRCARCQHHVAKHRTHNHPESEAAGPR